MLRLNRIALIAASVVASACASDGSTSPSVPAIETRLAATATAPTAALNDPTMTMSVEVRSTLPETVTGGRCASVVEARLATATAWTEVTSKTAVCSAIAISLAPGAVTTISAIADQAAVKAVAGSSKTVLMRARHTLSGASASYTLQTNEVSATLP